MNEGWKKEHGGKLKMYLRNKGNDVEVDVIEIEPLSDRLLVFQSRTIEHEVLSTFANRFAFTTWFY